MRGAISALFVGALAGAGLLWWTLGPPTPTVADPSSRRVTDGAPVRSVAATDARQSTGWVEFTQRSEARLRARESDESEPADGVLEADQPSQLDPSTQATLEQLAAQIVAATDGAERRKLVRAYQAEAANLSPEAMAQVLSIPGAAPTSRSEQRDGPPDGRPR